MTNARLLNMVGTLALLAVAIPAPADILDHNPALAHLVVKPENQRYTANAYNKPLTNI